MKHFPTTLVLICTALTAAIPLFAENLWDVIEEAQRVINQEYTGLAKESATNALKGIINSDKSTEQKIEEIRYNFPTRIKDNPKPVTQTFDYSQLIYRTPLEWNIHSIEIGYDIDSEVNILLSTETVRQEEDSKKRDDLSGLSNSDTNSKKSNNQIGFNAGIDVQTPSSSTGNKGFLWNILDWVRAKIGFEWVNDRHNTSQETNTKSSQWDESAQRALRTLFAEKSQILQNTKIRNCHLTFSISFKNNTNSVLQFIPQNVRVPVYAGNEHIADASPNTTLDIVQIFSNATVDQMFRAELNTTKAQSLIRYMRYAAPVIRLDRGQIEIKSRDGRIENAVQETLNNRTVPFRCQDLELQILRTHNGRQTTVGEAMRAINAIFEKPWFKITDDGSCISLMGIKMIASEKDVDLRQLPVIVFNGQPTSKCVSKEELNRPILETGLAVSVVNLLDDETWKDSSDGLIDYFMDYMKLMAESGDSEVSFRIGKIFALGIGAKQDNTKALEWYKKAAEQGYGIAQYLLGCYYCAGYELTQNYKEAVRWYTKAAIQDVPEAQCALGDCYYNGIGIERNESIAAEWYQKAAKQGNASAQDKLGFFYEYGLGGIQKDEREAADLYQKAAKQDIAHAQYRLGDFYYNGIVLEKNPSEAFNWYSKAADQGNAEAQYCLGNIYYIAQRFDDATKWYAEAANHGLATAQCALGDCYYTGRGTPKSNDWAVKCYSAAAEQNNLYALTALGSMFYTGFYYDNGSFYRNRDLGEEMIWQAGDMGFPDAQYRFAYICIENYGDRQAASTWLILAARQGHQEAQRALNSMQRQQR